MIPSEQMAVYKRLGDSKNVLPSARQAIRDLCEEVQRIHGTAVAQAEQIRALRERVAEATTEKGQPE